MDFAELGICRFAMKIVRISSQVAAGSLKARFRVYRVTVGEQSMPLRNLYCFSCTEMLGKRKICHLEAKDLMRQEPANDPNGVGWPGRWVG